MVLFDQGTYDKLLSEAPKFKLITPSILSDRLRINGSLARRAIKDLMARGSIRMISAHASQQIYTRFDLCFLRVLPLSLHSQRM